MPSIDVSIYKRHLERSKSSHNYFNFFRPYMLIMSLAEAVFIQDLINIGSMPKTKRRIIDDEEYFQCTESFLEQSGIFWQTDKQSRLFQSLKSKKYVSTKRIGLPSTRWIYINLVQIELDIDKAEQKDSRKYSPQNCGELSPPECGVKKKEDKKEENTHRREPAAPDRVNPFSFSMSCAQQLMDAVKTKVPGESNTRSTVRNWSRSFDKLLKTYPQDEIKLVLDTYCKNMGEEFWPEAFSGKSFYSKYENIRRKVNRKDKPVGIYVDREVTTKEKVDTPDGKFHYKFITKTVKDFVPGKWVKGDDGKKKFVADKDPTL